MRVLFGVFLLLFSFLSSFGQTPQYRRYWVQFTDKNNNPYSLNNPSAFLSEKSIERREKQNIKIDAMDLPLNPFYIDSVYQTGVTILNRSKWLNSVTIFTEDSLALVKISSFPFVKTVTPVGKKAEHDLSGAFFDLSGGYIPSENIFNYGIAGNQIEMLNGESLHEKGFRGQGMVIAMLDIGYLNADKLSVFDSLFTEGRVLGTHDYVAGNDSVFDFGTHGSMCLSTIASDIPGVFIGTAPKASFWLFSTEEEKTEYPVEELNWAAATEMADSVGADIISTSLGYTTFDSIVVDTVLKTKAVNPGNHSYADMNGKTAFASIAASTASAKGMIVCSSAGNSADGSPSMSRYYISSPADAINILAVGAVDSMGTIASFSSRGPSSDGRIKPDVAAQGKDATVIFPEYNSIAQLDGTSFSCPITAGMVACLWQAHRDKTNFEIMDAVKQSASFSHSPNNDYGYGIPNFALADLILSGVELSHFSPAASPLIFPNPFRSNPVVIYFSNENNNVKVELYDMLGRLVNVQTEKVIEGVNQLLPDFSNLANGSYMIRISTDKNSVLLRGVKL